MTKIYVVTGSEDGILGAGTNKKEAIEAAKEYIIQSLEWSDIFINESDLEIVSNDFDITISTNKSSVSAVVEIYESNKY